MIEQLWRQMATRATGWRRRLYAGGPPAVAARRLSVRLRCEEFESRVVPAVVPGVFDTGVAADASPLPDEAIDPHYTMADGSPVRAIVADGYPLGTDAATSPWVPNTATGRWIVPNASDADGNLAPGQYTFRVTFDLTTFDPRTAVLTGKWAVDNYGVDIKLNGVSLGITHSGTNPGDGFQGFKTLDTYTIQDGVNGAVFAAGTNTLDFVLNNDAYSPTNLTANPTGLFVDGLAVNATPIPAGSVPGLVYDDTNNDYQQSPGEPGHAGVTISLLKDGTAVKSTTTDANGLYAFNNVAAGSYTVSIQEPGGYVAVNTTTDHLAEEYVQVGAGGAVAGVNFCLQTTLDGPVDPNSYGDTTTGPTGNVQPAGQPPAVGPVAAALSAEPAAAPPSQPAAAQHAIDWSTLTMVQANVRPWARLPYVGSNWTVKTFSGQTILCWSGDPGQPAPATTFFCHGNSFGGVGIMVTVNGQLVARNFSPYSDGGGRTDVSNLLTAEYVKVNGFQSQPGDIAVFRAADGSVVHTAILTNPVILGPGLSLDKSSVSTKNGPDLNNGLDQPKTMTLDQLDRLYAMYPVNNVPQRTTLEFWRLKSN